ncbi:MAG: ribose 5-phosphate isomerase B [Alphaproteobacteria bacterium]|nr:ribose 5-phosphate isomerase B [Alphaproteobacteria bacterium]
MKHTISIGSDHRGFDIKEIICKHLHSCSYSIIDHGPESQDISVDYPDYAIEIAKSVHSGETKFGVLICNTGIGMSIAANRLPGVRAALCRTIEDALFARKHNDANILVLGSQHLTTEIATKLVDTFFNTEFENGRHLSRLKKIDTIL